jgi:hypothetical protein
MHLLTPPNWLKPSLELDGLPPPGDNAERARILARLEAAPWPEVGLIPSFLGEVAANGAVVEELLQGAEQHSPSAQLAIAPSGEVKLVSTHDQILHGSLGQTYFGARFPENHAYAALVGREALKIGTRLAAAGAVGWCSIDFVVARATSGEWRAFALEINLRTGGTTHSLMMLQHLTGGGYDAETCAFVTPERCRKFYMCSDLLESADYRCFAPDALIELMRRHDLLFDPRHQTGVVLHMLGSAAMIAHISLMAVGESPETAEQAFRAAVAVIEHAALCARAR